MPPLLIISADRFHLDALIEKPPPSQPIEHLHTPTFSVLSELPLRRSQGGNRDHRRRLSGRLMLAAVLHMSDRYPWRGGVCTPERAEFPAVRNPRILLWTV
jgi:hypothetical protein